jgi:hypothetical protein
MPTLLTLDDILVDVARDHLAEKAGEEGEQIRSINKTSRNGGI